MPKEIIVVRHGYCIGEEAKIASEKGHDGFFTAEFRAADSKAWPLTLAGEDQARSAGKKIRESVARNFDAYLCADTLRTLETARHFHFLNADWKINPFLRARDWNGFENIPIPERRDRCMAAGIPYEEDSITWHPPGGESMLAVVHSIRSFLEGTHREYKEKKLLIVTHGSPFQAFRLIQHKIPPSGYLDFINRNGYTRNCQISRYYHKSGLIDGIPMYKKEQSFFLAGDNKWEEVTARLEDR